MKCCEITPGMLRHRIAIQREQRTEDGIGGAVLVWNDLYNPVSAFIKPKTGNEFLHSQRLEARVSHSIYLRYIQGLRPTDRIVYDGRTFQIRAILNIEERNKWYELLCEEGVAQ